MSRIWLPLIILAGVVAAGFYFLQPGDPESMPALPSQGFESTQVIASAPTVELPVPSAPVVERVVEETVKKDNDPRPYATPVKEGGVLITVIDLATKEPLPLAHVLVIDGAVANLNEFIQRQEREKDLPRLLRSFAKAYKTNEQAQVRIPEPEGFLILAAETKTHFEFVSGVDVSSGAYTLGIGRMDRCVVQVVDKLGKPAGRTPGLLFVREHNYSNPLVFSYSEADGMMSFPFFRVMRERVTSPVFASLRILAREEVKTPIDLKHLPEVPPMLVLPPTGSVEIKVVDEKGRPVKELYFMRLSILDSGLTEYPNPEGRPSHPGKFLNYGTDRGGLTYSHVETGLNLGVRVSTSNGDLYETAVGPGPKVQGEKVTFVLQPKIHGVLLTGRLLNAKRMVGKNISASVWIDSSNMEKGQWEQRSFRTDDEGRFRVKMTTEYESGEKRQLQIILQKTKRKPKRGAQMDLSFHIPLGEYDIGDVVLDIPPLFAKGRTVDMHGEPVNRVQLTAQLATTSFPSEHNSDWVNVGTLSARTMDNGDFEIRGFSRPGKFRLKAVHSHFSTTLVQVKPGDADLVVQMEEPVVLKGRILVDDDIDLSDLSLRLKESSGTTSFGHHIKTDGSFSIGGMESQSGTLIVASASTGEEFEIFTNLNFEDPGSAMRIAVIDLRGRLHYSTLTVVNESGQAIDQVYAKAGNSDSARQHSKQPIKLLTSGGDVDMQISALGYRSVQLPRLDRDFDLVLRKGTPVRVVVSNEDLIDKKVDLNLSLVFESANPEDTRNSYIRLRKTEHGYWEGNAGIAGSFRLQMSLQRNTKKQGGNNSYAVGEAVHYQIDDSEAIQDLDLTLPPKVIAFAERLATREG